MTFDLGSSDRDAMAGVTYVLGIYHQICNPPTRAAGVSAGLWRLV